MTLNEYCLMFYGNHWILLLEYQQVESIERYRNLSDIFDDLFNPFKG